MNVARLITEHELTLAQASRHVPGRPCTATLLRWHKRGSNGVRLEAFKSGGRWYTTREAITRFLQGINGQDSAKLETEERSAVAARLDAIGIR